MPVIFHSHTVPTTLLIWEWILNANQKQNPAQSAKKLMSPKHFHNDESKLKRPCTRHHRPVKLCDSGACFLWGWHFIQVGIQNGCNQAQLHLRGEGKCQLRWWGGEMFSRDSNACFMIDCSSKLYSSSTEEVEGREIKLRKGSPSAWVGIHLSHISGAMETTFPRTPEWVQEDLKVFRKGPALNYHLIQRGYKVAAFWRQLHSNGFSSHSFGMTFWTFDQFSFPFGERYSIQSALTVDD